MAKKEAKTPATPEQKTMRKAVKLVAFNSWRQDWRAANPDASAEDRKAAWTEVKTAEMRKARRTLKQLEKGGVRLVEAEAAAEA